MGRKELEGARKPSTYNFNATSQVRRISKQEKTKALIATDRVEDLVVKTKKYKRRERTESVEHNHKTRTSERTQTFAEEGESSSTATSQPKEIRLKKNMGETTTGYLKEIKELELAIEASSQGRMSASGLLPMYLF